MKKKYDKNASVRRFRLGMVFLVFLFFLLLGAKALITEKFIPGQNIDDAYGLQITHNILPEESPIRTNTPRIIKYIVIHETGNHDSTADSKSHSQYLADNGDGSTGWHYTVDENTAYHHIPDDEIAYHAGKGNISGIGIELCVNDGSDFDKTFENGAKLTAKLIKAYRLSVRSIKQHADFMDKNCPETIRSNNRWSEFISLVKQYIKEN